ncbi:MAG: J domain-containing protein, partial [Gallionella sp.]|nr:J domain-containing protein [Gallionella sp.]
MDHIKVDGLDLSTEQLSPNIRILCGTSTGTAGKLVKSRALQEASLENPYNILGVSPTASTEDIKKAYRALAMRHHPDRNPHSSAEVRFNAIKKAYELLSDPQKRAEY